jgi:enoyl-[acyl-carrier-protein] reductase (NADH)
MRIDLTGRTATTSSAPAAPRPPRDGLTEPEDVANVVLFLVSPLAEMVIGQTVIVDGGYSVLA